MIKFEFPVLIEQNKSGYTLQPLLSPGFIVRRARYGDAIKTLHQLLRKKYTQRKIDDELINEILWYSYSPDIKFELPYLVLKSGMRHIEGHFTVVTYRLGQHRYLCLPKLNHLTVRVASDVKSHNEFIDYVSQKISWYFRELRKENDDIYIKQYLSTSSDSYVIINATTEMASQRFPFEFKSDGMFALMGNNEQFDGASELLPQWLERVPSSFKNTLYKGINPSEGYSLIVTC